MLIRGVITLPENQLLVIYLNSVILPFRGLVDYKKQLLLVAIKPSI